MFKSLLWFLINFKQTTRKSNNSATTCTDHRLAFSWNICTLCWYVSPSFFIHFWHISMTTEPMSVTLLHVTLGNKFWSWSLGSFLEKKKWRYVWKNTTNVLYSVFWCSFFVRLCLLFKILVPLTGTEFPLITLSSQQYDWL